MVWVKQCSAKVKFFSTTISFKVVLTCAVSLYSLYLEMSCVQSRPESLFQNKWFIEWSCCYLNHKWTKSDNITELFFLIHPVLMWSWKGSDKVIASVKICNMGGTYLSLHLSEMALPFHGFCN